MGSFTCRCGYRLGRTPPEAGTAFVLLSAESLDGGPDLTVGAVGQTPLGEVPDLAGSLHQCPNCGRVHWETANKIRTFVLDTHRPHIWADIENVDEFGRVRLSAPKSLNDIEQQKLLLQPPLPVVLYQDDGSEFPGEAEFGLGSDEELDLESWVVRLESRQADEGS